MVIGVLSYTASRTARPAASRFVRFISEYFRERMIPSGLARNAAFVAAYESSGDAFRLPLSVGMQISIPVMIRVLPFTPAIARAVSRYTYSGESPAAGRFARDASFS